MQIMNRTKRAHVGQETIAIVERGWYEAAGGRRVDIAHPVAECLRTTKTLPPAELDHLRSTVPAGNRDTDIAVANETTLSAAYRLVVEHGHAKTLCLNFASAKNPGGGFLGGSQAQEESLARSSALYASLLTQNAYYDANRSCRTTLYTDHVILSPRVPVFRDDQGQLLPEPYLLSILTSPAVNAGAIKKNEPEKENLIRPTMARRIANVLAVSAINGYEHLILGAWGCGVFRNDPGVIAELFAEALLHNGLFRNRFRSVTFAVLDSTPDETVIRPFCRHFGRATP
jgi:uncharacterized protein (TIGR02452 family)